MTHLELNEKLFKLRQQYFKTPSIDLKKQIYDLDRKIKEIEEREYIGNKNCLKGNYHGNFGWNKKYGKGLSE